MTTITFTLKDEAGNPITCGKCALDTGLRWVGKKPGAHAPGCPKDAPKVVTFGIGDKVVFNGNWLGTVVLVHTGQLKGMCDVRAARGATTVPFASLRLVTVWDLECQRCGWTDNEANFDVTDTPGERLCPRLMNDGTKCGSNRCVSCAPLKA